MTVVPMSDEFRMRSATNADGEAIRRVVFAALREHGLAPDPDATDADLADIEASYLRPGGSFDVLVNAAGEIVGTVGLHPIDRSRCELRKMYLAAECRGRGLGKRLLQHALERARQLGFHRIELETASVLAAAGKLYESFGFRQCAPRHLSPRCDRAYYLNLSEKTAPVRSAVKPLILVLAIALAGIGAISLLRNVKRPPPAIETIAHPLKLQWTFTAPRPGAAVAAPRVAKDAIYFAAIHARGFKLDGAVYCLDPSTGKSKWSFDADGTMLPTGSSPALANGRLYFGEGMHANFSCRLFCLDAATGKQFWTFPTTDHIEGGPLILGDAVIFPAGNDGLYAVDAATGKMKWNFRADLHIDSTPLVVGDRLFVGSGPSKRFSTSAAVCLDAATGRELWRTPMELPVWATPAAANGRIFAALGNGRLTKAAEPPERPAGGLACLDANSGAIRWSHPFEGAAFGQPAVAGGCVFLGCRDGSLFCYSDDGELKFRESFGKPIVSSPRIHGDFVLAADVLGQVRCIQHDGYLKWQFDLPRGANVYAPLRGRGRRLYIAAEMRPPEAAYGMATLSCYELTEDR